MKCTHLRIALILDRKVDFPKVLNEIVDVQQPVEMTVRAALSEEQVVMRKENVESSMSHSCATTSCSWDSRTKSEANLLFHDTT